MLIRKRNKYLCMLLLLGIILSLNGTTVKAGFDANKNQNMKEMNNNQIDSSVFNKEISQWNQIDIYGYGDLVLYDNKVYFACKKMQGLTPEETEDWLLKADLSIYEADSGKSLCLYDNSSLYRDSVAKIIAYNADLSTSRYQFAVGCLLPVNWTAQVNSVIQYDNGAHTIIKNDFFKNDINFPLKMQVRNYYFRQISRVTVVVSGQYNGKILDSKGMTMYP